jgi:hypothetical protein
VFCKIFSVECEVLTATVTEKAIFWDIRLCGPLKVNRRFGVVFRLRLQRPKISQARNQHEAENNHSSVFFPMLLAGFFLGLRFHPEDGGHMFR